MPTSSANGKDFLNHQMKVHTFFLTSIYPSRILLLSNQSRMLLLTTKTATHSRVFIISIIARN